MVHSDADGCVILFADVEERHEPVTNFLQLCCILLVGVLQLLEGACFATKAALLAGPYYYKGQLYTPTNNDYALVEDDETKIEYQKYF